MKCFHCQSENRIGAKFCEECGTALPRVCSNCGSEISETAKFCAHCGRSAAAESVPHPRAPHSYTPKHLADKILNRRSALEGERKQVTVLFVDVVGSTPQAERLDPEDVHARMSRAIELMVEVVHRYEGTVNQFLGDGVMALFGAPIAHEDHARRAVQAALGIRAALQRLDEELREEHGLGFQVRQGINTGLVVVGSVGTDLRMDYTAVGDTTNVAARLEREASPGSILVSDKTRRLVEGYFEFREIGPLNLKGKSKKVVASEILSAKLARTRIDIETDRGLTPLMGREKEIQAVVEAFKKSKSGSGQIVLLEGEAGIGKSRLLVELRHRIGTDATWCEGHALSFGRSMVFHTLIDMLRRLFQIKETDSEQALTDSVEQAVLELGDELRPALPYLLYLLSLEQGDAGIATMDPRLRRAEIFDALKRYFLLAARARPQVMVFEDLHWIDPVTEEFLRVFVDSVPAVRVLVVLTFRPDYSYPFGQRSYQSHLSLNPLSIEQIVKMTDVLFGEHRVSEEVRSSIYRDCGGNPFFVEELIKARQEAGSLTRDQELSGLSSSLSGIGVPVTVQDALMARIDSLSEEAKRIVQLASVIGREFSGRLISAVGDMPGNEEEVIQELKSKELIYEKSLFPETAYIFKHALTQEVAYGSLLIRRRQELHEAVGIAIEKLYSDRPSTYYEVLAYHFSKADAWQKALDYLIKSGQKAVGSYALQEALNFYDEALEALDKLGADAPASTRLEIHSARSNVLFGVGDFVNSREEADKVHTIAEGIGDLKAQAEALAQGALARVWFEEFDDAVFRASEAIKIGEQAGAQAALGTASLATGFLNAVRGDLQKAEEGFGRALGASRSIGDFTTAGNTLYGIAALRGWCGKFPETISVATEGVTLSREKQAVIPLIRCLWAQGLGYTGLGQYEAALTVLQEGLSLCEKVGDQGFACRQINTMGWLRIECGDLEHGIELSEESLDLNKGNKHAVGVERRAFILCNEGDALLAKGDFSAAADKLGEVLHIVNHPPPSRWMTWRYATHCHVSLGELALARGDPAAADQRADQSLEIAVPTNSRKYESRAWRVKGESALMRKRWNEAEKALRDSLAIAQSIDEPVQLWKSYVSLARLDDVRKRADAAERNYTAARQVLEHLFSNVRDTGLRAGLEGQIRSLRAL